MSRRFVLALDQGTTSSRAMVFDRKGLAHGLAQQEFPQHFPRPGWVEHNPVEIWERTGSVIQSALNNTNLSAGDLAAPGITNQRET